MSSIDALELWKKLSVAPGGKWAFSRALCFKAPYFGSIKPLFEELRPGRCTVRVRKQRAVLNHLGTVHAIALCNMAELVGGTMTEVTIPKTHRWIPKGMTVEYLKKANHDVLAIAEPGGTVDWSKAGEYKVGVIIKDTVTDEDVFRAMISMWVSPKKLAA